MVEAKYFQQFENGDVKCSLCPHLCKLSDGKIGVCNVRMNRNGKLYSLNYGILTAINVDPVEKKPLYHFFPGKNILSIGSNGCNMQCSCCQNWEISQTSSDMLRGVGNTKIGEIVDMAKNKTDNIGVAFTYNEPTIWIEYLLDVARKVKEEGLRNVLVSNGLVNQEPLLDMIECVDAFNIDLKAFTEKKYRQMTKSPLEPVKESIKTIAKSGRHVELTHLVIPGFNDDPDEFNDMLKWIKNEAGEETVLHISRYFPTYQMTEEATPTPTLSNFRDMALDKLKYVYLGNINIKSAQDTFCSKCGKKVISRGGYLTEIIAIDGDGNCNYCGNPVVINK